ncbi:histidinol-phosphate transaminase [Isosphaeraceae bacterium EP7]
MSSYFRPEIDRMQGYVPGEQPRGGSVTKLNTNENPYPPSPRVAEAIAASLGEPLRRYPDPVGTDFRKAAARLHGVSPEMILAGNGSDDLLTILTRAFVGQGQLAVAPTPSYILYRTLIEIQGGRFLEVPFDSTWRLDHSRFAHPEARLAYLANPNSPSGTMLTPDEVSDLANKLPCPLIVDEAYGDFADLHCIALIADHPNVIVTRTLSKGYGLAGLRLGYLIARPEIVDGLSKVKDSYNCDLLSLVGATAALDDQPYLGTTRALILATRARLVETMRRRGYTVPDTQANFAWCTGGPPAAPLYEALKSRGILVRLMRYPGYDDGLRITVGTDEQVDHFLEVHADLTRP